ncbi:MAG: hypothetical protein WC966_01120 [Bradymonadales bacterium]
MSKATIAVLFLASCLAFIACKPKEKTILESCQSLEEASKMTQNCDKMQKEVKRIGEVMLEQLEGIPANDKMSVEQVQEYKEAIGVCLRALVFIGLGPCSFPTDTLPPGVRQKFNSLAGE